MDFFYNIAISVWGFISWYLAGLGPALILLPRVHRSKTFLLAPLLGMCLLTLIGLFQITVLLTPILPRINVGVLILISLLLCFICRNDFKVAWMGFFQRQKWLWLQPFLLVLMFAWMFHNGGFQMLVGGSDQLQYSSNARQILEEMHTGSPQDTPIPRQDHYTYEMNTRMLPYSKNYRRGAEVMLATIKATTGLSYEEAFPVTVLCAYLVLGLALGFLGLVFFRLLLSSCLVLQAALLSSFYLLMVHIQGSLALLMALAPGLIALALLWRVIFIFSWRWLWLSVIVLAAYVSIYAEPVLISIVLPCLLLVLLRFRQSWRGGFLATGHLALIFFLIFICAPFAVGSVIANVFGNLSVAYSQLHPVLETVAPAVQVNYFNTMLQQGNMIAVVFGNVSYYDGSSFNQKIVGFIAKHPWIGWVELFVLCGLGLFGYLKFKNRLAKVFSVVLIFWIFVCLFMVCHQDILRFARSLQYAMPLAVIGLILLASRYRWWYVDREKIFDITMAGIGKVVLVIFIITNIYTGIRTIHFITSHDISNDSVLLRFDERIESWKLLQKELSFSALHDTPILFSGFKETIRPLAIAIIARSQPQVLGASITSFWPMYTDHLSGPKIESIKANYNTRLSEEVLSKEQLAQSRRWIDLVPQLIRRSEQAVVPVGAGFPIEWSSSQDVYAPRIKRFANICDVVYRNQYVVTLEQNKISSLKKDVVGTYRLLWASSPIMVRDKINTPHQLVINYTGKVGDIKLQVLNHFYYGKMLDSNGAIRITATVSPDEVGKINLIVVHPVKLRSMEWAPIS